MQVQRRADAKNTHGLKSANFGQESVSKMRNQKHRKLQELQGPAKPTCSIAENLGNIFISFNFILLNLVSLNLI